MNIQTQMIYPNLKKNKIKLNKNKLRIYCYNLLLNMKLWTNICQEEYDGEIPLENYILNENNVYITESYVEELLKSNGINHKVSPDALKIYQQAMVHKSYLVIDEITEKKLKNNSDIKPISDPSLAIPLQTESYERLEFLGDSVIHLVFAGYLYKRYPNQAEGFMTRLRTKLESGETLSQISIAIGLNKYIWISQLIENNNARTTYHSMLEDSFESFIGALYLDVGFHNVNKFMISLIEKRINFTQIISTETNYKDILLRHFHVMKWMDPQYNLLDTSGSDTKTFLVYVKCRKNENDLGETIGYGQGSSKKKGEQEAAKQALLHLGVKLSNECSEDSDSDDDY